MNELFPNVLTASFHGSIVIATVFLLRPLLKKTPKKFLCLLWMLAFVRLLMPFEIRSELSLQPEPVVQEQQILMPVMSEILEPDVTAVDEVQSQPVQNAIVQNDAPVAGGEKPSQTPAPTGAMVSEQKEKSEIEWTAVIPCIWLTVASCFALYCVYSYTRLKLQVREAIKIPGGWECDRIETAFILGFIRPKIYIPMGLPGSVRKHILAHERTHLEKGDHWIKMIGYIALAIHWFNPLVWLAYILLCKDIELACDERVVQFMELEERKSYSAALLTCSTNRAHFAACPVAFGEVSVKERIKSVLNYRKPSFWISLLGVIAIIFVAVCLLTSPVEEDEATAAGEEATTGSAETVTVNNIDELLAAIAPDTRIQLNAGTYNLCEASDYGKETGSDYYSWETMYDGYQLVLRGVENLTLRGAGKVSTSLVTDPRWANVLVLQNCNSIALEDFTAGHSDGMGECSGGVVYLQGCTDVRMDGLGLFGCGTVGLNTELCSEITMTNSDIYECSSSAVVVNTGKDITVSGCRIYDIGREEYGGYTFFELNNSRSVVVQNCQLSTSTLNCLVSSGDTHLELRNNLFTDNRAQNGAFSFNGKNVTLDGNKFEGNTIRSWYSGYGNIARDKDGNDLSETKLNEMYPTAPAEITQPQLQIHVSTVDELIAAIGPNTEIILDGELYEFSEATGYGTSSGEYYYWEDVYDGPGLVIRGVDNMTIRTSDGDVTAHTLSAVPRYADVLAFKACSNITLSGFTAGHTIEPGSCAGGVLEFRDCDNMTVDNCGLYGCGILGVYAEYSSNITVKNSDIYECSQGGIQMRNTRGILLENNTFRDLGGDETTFIGCTDIDMEGQLLNPKTDTDENVVIDVEPTEAPVVVDEEDIVNLGHAVTGFAEALFRGDEASMQLYLASTYDLPLEIPEDLAEAMLSADQSLPADYANEMESKGYCTLTVKYSLYYEEYDAYSTEKMTLEMCRENGVWKVQYYTTGDTEVELLDKDLYNFTYAYLMQDLELLEPFLADSYTRPVEVYFGDGNKVVTDPDYSVGNTFSNAYLAGLDSYSAAIPFKESADSDSYTYLNVALQRRENKKTYDDGRIDSEWVVVDYGIENAAQEESGLPEGIQIESIQRENYTGSVMLIDDPERVFLGLSTKEGFSTDIPGKRIGEMMEVYPNAVAAINAGDFFDDGTTSDAVGSLPMGLVFAEGETVWNRGDAQGEGFAGFNSEHVLVVSDKNLSQEEAEALDIQDGCNGIPLIIDMEVQQKIEETNSGYNTRTAIGQRADGTVIFLCINGRIAESLGATYADVIHEMMTYGAVNACLMHGGSTTGMIYRSTDASREPQLITKLQVGQTQPRRLPVYWMVDAK